MPMPKAVAVAVCATILGVQGVIASPPLLRRYGSEWPFLPYPMYADARARGDSFVMAELRVARCGLAPDTVAMTPAMLGTPLYQLPKLVEAIARAPGSAPAREAMGKVSRAVDAEFPHRYCSASAWVRSVFVSDTATYALRNPLRSVAAWPIDALSAR